MHRFARHAWLVLAGAVQLPAAQAADPAPPWLLALDEIRMLPDPFDARAIAAIAHAPRFVPRCVPDRSVMLPRVSCHAELVDAGPVRRATLTYIAATEHGPAASGQLGYAIAADPCTSLEQVQDVFARRLEPAMPPTIHIAPGATFTPSGVFPYTARLFGDGMQPIALQVSANPGRCVTWIALSR